MSDAVLVAEKIRALAARCLLGMARDPAIRHILGKLQVIPWVVWVALDRGTGVIENLRNCDNFVVTGAWI